MPLTVSRSVSLCLQMRISKEQEHFLVLPDGLTYAEVTASNLVRVPQRDIRNDYMSCKYLCLIQLFYI